jgi:hypothetical protein
MEKVAVLLGPGVEVGEEEVGVAVNVGVGGRDVGVRVDVGVGGSVVGVRVKVGVGEGIVAVRVDVGVGGNGVEVNVEVGGMVVEEGASVGVDVLAWVVAVAVGVAPLVNVTTNCGPLLLDEDHPATIFLPQLVPVPFKMIDKLLPLCQPA